jgi:hypothetical protein
MLKLNWLPEVPQLVIILQQSLKRNVLLLLSSYGIRKKRLQLQ